MSTRVLKPHYAVAWAAFFNFIAFLFFGLHVANTVGKGIISADIISDSVIFGALGGAIFWNVLTWLLGIPSSSSHALIGGLVGGLVVCWSSLNLGPSFFFQRLVEDGTMAQHLMVGLVKAPVFALVIAAIGCRQGMSVAGDVESLGRRVTAAVVQAIFAIIFLDAVFALVFLELNI